MSEPPAASQVQGRYESGPVLRKALTLYLDDRVDRQQVGQLVKAMCSLNGITFVAIELHGAAAPDPSTEEA